MFVFLSEKSTPDHVAADIQRLRGLDPTPTSLSADALADKNRALAPFVGRMDALIAVVEAQLESQRTLEGTGYRPMLDVRELPDTRVFVTFPLRTEGERASLAKCDVAAVCFGFNSLSLADGHVDAQIVVEDDTTTHYLSVPGVGIADVATMVLGFARALVRRKPGQQIELLEFTLKIAQMLESYQFDFQYSKDPLPAYCPYDTEAAARPENLHDLAWVRESFPADRPLSHRGERQVRCKVGERSFDVLEVGEAAFVLENHSTLEVLDAAIEAGLVGAERRNGFLTEEQERAQTEQTAQQYVDSGNVTGEDKDLRINWREAKPAYAYDPVRGLYYLSIEDEPVMDEFERRYISLLGYNAARLGGAVLEIGFGMGISANAIQRELAQHHAPAEGRPAVHVIIELNRHVAAFAREWGQRQAVPVVVLEGDWRDAIGQVPSGVLSGALSDPYPLNPSEKHKDAALALEEIHRCLRPGGVSVHYSDSQYALRPDHEALARAAGFELMGCRTSSFGSHLNTGEYYAEGLRMLVPALHKAGGIDRDEPLERTEDAASIERLLSGLFDDGT